MVFLYTICTVFTLYICESLSGCIYNRFDKLATPLFSTTVFDDHEIIIEPYEPSITISEGGILNAYCHSNFSLQVDSGGSTHSFGDQIKIHCKNGSLIYLTEDGANLQMDNNQPIDLIESYQPMLSCLETISLYLAHSPYCEKLTIAYGLNAIPIPIFLADICLDVGTMETLLVHYGTKRVRHLSNIDTKLQHPDLYLHSNIKLATDFIRSNEERTEQLNASLQLTLPKAFRSFVYRFDELVPSKHLLDSYKVESQLLLANSIAWWTKLKDGNWKSIERLTEKHTQTREYDIYTGVLYYNEPYLYYRKDIAHHLQYSLYSLNKKIPFYVWKYIKPRSPFESANEVVIIGINYPFLRENEVSSLQFCMDICDQIDWLRGIKHLRKAIGFGYVFCCKPNDASQRIAEINKIKYSFRNMFTQEP